MTRTGEQLATFGNRCDDSIRGKHDMVPPRHGVSADGVVCDRGPPENSEAARVHGENSHIG